MHRYLSRTGLVAIALAIAAVTQPQSAVAADYPTRNIELVIPYVPGGAVDAVTRSLARGLGERLGVSVVVINRGGAGTIVGTQSVARAAPDGYTLMLTSVPFTTNPSLYNKLPYTQNDFIPIMMVANSPSLLTVNAKLPANNLAEFIDYLKARPGQVNYASYGNGTSSHLAALLFEAKTGTQMQHVPYKGGGPASIAVVANEVQVVFATPTAVMGAIEAKQLKALAMAAPERIAIMSTVPTFQEQGIDYQSGAWFGLFAPAGTPADIVKRIHMESAAYLARPEVRKSLHDIGLVVIANTPEQFATFVADETEMWRDLLTKLAVPKL
jgi:tripartite-type tricarboxylate transporter receptor subunit TctC